MHTHTHGWIHKYEINLMHPFLYMTVLDSTLLFKQKILHNHLCSMSLTPPLSLGRQKFSKGQMELIQELLKKKVLVPPRFLEIHTHTHTHTHTHVCTETSDA